MGLEYRDLEDSTRTLMLAEIERDVAANTLYISKRLTVLGQAQYPALLQGAARGGSDETLARQLRTLLNDLEDPRPTKSGRLSKPRKMPKDAHEMLAEGEFNRFYIRAVCRRVIEEALPKAPGPERVARAIHRALTARRPRVRYPVGPDAPPIVLARRLLPDRLSLWLLRRYFQV